MIPATDLVARIALNAVAALVAVCILLLAVLLVILIVRSRAHLAREAARAAARPVLQKYVVEYLAGSAAIWRTSAAMLPRRSCYSRAPSAAAPATGCAVSPWISP
jgi:ABC-type transport system involved in cytochrome bd biosynthesis fused ATPase/permease subunit